MNYNVNDDNQEEKRKEEEDVNDRQQTETKTKTNTNTTKEDNQDDKRKEKEEEEVDVNDDNQEDKRKEEEEEDVNDRQQIETKSKEKEKDDNDETVTTRASRLLCAAAETDELPLAQWLCAQHGARVNSPCADSPLLRAATGASAEMCEWLIAQGAELDCRDESRRSALCLAICFGNAAVAHTLLAAGASTVGAVWWCASMRDAAMLHTLLFAFGADPDDVAIRALDPTAGAALRVAAEDGESRMLELLLLAGADVALADSDASEQTAAELAASTWNYHCVKLLEIPAQHWRRTRDRRGRQKAADVAIALASLDLPVLCVQEIYEWLEWPRLWPSATNLWSTLQLCKEFFHKFHSYS